MNLKINELSCGYENKKVVSNISLEINSGEILCILGPNGVGKTTFFKTVLGFLPLMEGEILINDENIKKTTKKNLAKIIGYVPQSHIPPFPFKVIDVVVMGRTAHMGMFAAPSKTDIKIAEQALDSIGVSFLKNRIYTEISGGERQMVLIARALTQEPQLLIMDEPTSNLDYGNQIRILEQINYLAESGMGVVMTSHFPDHAFLCSSKVVLMQKNDIIKVGTADDIVTEKNLKSAYGIDVKILDDKDYYGNVIRACIPCIKSKRSFGVITPKGIA